MMRRLFTPIRIALLMGLMLSALRWYNPELLQVFDARAMDYRQRVRGPVEPQGRVVIVAIDDRSLAQVGRWVWPRAVLAQLFQRLDAAAPRVIALDIVFSETSEFQEQPGLSARPEPVSEAEWNSVQRALRAQDEVLADVFARSGRIVLGYFLDFDGVAPVASSRYLSTYNSTAGSPGGRSETKLAAAVGANLNLPQFEGAARATGYFNVFPDIDGPVRRMPLVIPYKDQMLLPLALSTLRVFAPGRSLHLRFDRRGAGVDDVRFGPLSIPVDEEGRMLINYRGPGRTFPHISAVDVLRGTVAPEVFRDRIVLVGVTAQAVFDLRVTPFDERFPGVEIHANVIDNILQGDFLHQPSRLVVGELATILGLALILGVALIRARGVAAALVAVALVAAYAIGSQVIFVSRGWPLSLFYPVLAVSLSYASIALLHYVTEERERKKMRSALDLYLSPSMAELLSRHPERLRLGGEQRELTVFFSDIRGFTSLTERLDPEVLSEILNEYLGDMTDIVFAYDGMLDKYVGDAVMAVWGAPMAQPDHARRACLATLDMIDRLPVLNQRWQERGLPALAIGCGLNTGTMKFGNYGSTRHMAITVIGDNVNLGSRLEGLTKVYHADIIAAEATVLAADGAVVARELDQVRVKGKAEAVRIFQILGRAEERQRWEELLAAFSDGLRAYRERRWEQALAIFETICTKYPGDGPAHVFATRCRALLVSPPGPDWDSVTTMESK